MDPITIIGIVSSSLKLLDVSISIIQRISKLNRKDDSDENKTIDRAAKQLKRNGVLLDTQLKDAVIWGSASITLLGAGYFAVHSNKKILFVPVLTLVINSIGETSKRIGSIVLISKDSEDARKLILISEVTQSELQKQITPIKIPDDEVKLMYKKEFKSDGLIPLTMETMLKMTNLVKRILRIKSKQQGDSSHNNGTTSVTPNAKFANN